MADSNPPGSDPADDLVRRAALLGDFDPLVLLSGAENDAGAPAWLSRLGACCIEREVDGELLWRLKADERVRVLRTLADPVEIDDLVARTPPAKNDVFGAKLQGALTERASAVKADAPLSELGEAYSAVGFAALAPVTPSSGRVDPERVRLDLQRASTEAVPPWSTPDPIDRTKELDRISTFLSAPSSRPAPASPPVLAVTGAEGAGKSALLVAARDARAQAGQRVALLDFGLPALSGGDPVEITREILRQVQETTPDPEQARRIVDARRQMGALEGSGTASQARALRTRARVRELAGPVLKADQPVAVLLDSLERVADAGATTVVEVWKWLAALDRAAGGGCLRLVVTARGSAVIAARAVETVPLVPMALDTALEFLGLARWLPVPPEWSLRLRTLINPFLGRPDRLVQLRAAQTSTSGDLSTAPAESLLPAEFGPELLEKLAEAIRRLGGSSPGPALVPDESRGGARPARRKIRGGAGEAPSGFGVAMAGALDDRISRAWVGGNPQEAADAGEQAFSTLWEQGSREAVVLFRGDPVHLPVWKAVLACAATGKFPTALVGSGALAHLLACYPKPVSGALTPMRLHLAAVLLARAVTDEKFAQDLDPKQKAMLAGHLVDVAATVRTAFDLRLCHLACALGPGLVPGLRLPKPVVPGRLVRLLVPFQWVGAGGLVDGWAQVGGRFRPPVPSDAASPGAQETLSAMAHAELEFPARPKPPPARLIELHDLVLGAVGTAAEGNREGLAGIAALWAGTPAWPAPLQPEAIRSGNLTPAENLALLIDACDQRGHLGALVRELQEKSLFWAGGRTVDRIEGLVTRMEFIFAPDFSDLLEASVL